MVIKHFFYVNGSRHGWIDRLSDQKTIGDGGGEQNKTVCGRHGHNAELQLQNDGTFSTYMRKYQSPARPPGGIYVPSYIDSGIAVTIHPTGG